MSNLVNSSVHTVRNTNIFKEPAIANLSCKMAVLYLIDEIHRKGKFSLYIHMYSLVQYIFLTHIWFGECN